jgi:hypothetical protein
MPLYVIKPNDNLRWGVIIELSSVPPHVVVSFDFGESPALNDGLSLRLFRSS